MALDISSLQEYVKLYPDLLIKTVYQDTMLNMFPVEIYDRQTPGPYKARIFEPAAHLAECCTIPDGESSVIEVDMEAVCLLDGSEYCETDLAQILRNEDFVFTAGNESAGSIEEQITLGQISAFTEVLDILTFQGDKTASSENLNKIDGLIKQAVDSPDTIRLTATGSNAVQILQQAALSIPVNAYKMGQIAIFVPEDFGNAFQVGLLNLNNQWLNPGQVNLHPYNGFPLPGFGNITVIPTRGLNGTNNILITPIKNILWLTNRTNDHNTLDWDYDKYHQKYYWRIKTIFGVKLLIPEWAVLVTYDAAALNNLGGIPVDIVSPRGANGGVLTDDTP